jgi:predicted 3-demethylubiquinone-9 3-methyltransferase (glyoxalase superfamily)
MLVIGSSSCPIRIHREFHRMPTITPFLWFDNTIQEALDFYPTVFENVEVQNLTRAGKDGPIFTASFRIENQEFLALNGGPDHPFTDAISFYIDCEDQDEVDYYWAKLTDGGEPRPCGWLKDRFGLNWQVISRALPELLGGGGDPERGNRVMQAMMQMSKIDVAKLHEAYDAA